MQPDAVNAFGPGTIAAIIAGVSVSTALLASILVRHDVPRCAITPLSSLTQFRKHFQELCLCLLQSSHEASMTVSINRFSSLDILQERVFGFVHFRLCSLDILHTAHQEPPRTGSLF